MILEGLSSAVHYGDPVAALNIDPVLTQLREDIKTVHLTSGYTNLNTSYVWLLKSTSSILLRSNCSC